MVLDCCYLLCKDNKNPHTKQYPKIFALVYMKKARQPCRALLLYFLFRIENNDIQWLVIENLKRTENESIK
jgi:hypothetical protein